MDNVIPRVMGCAAKRARTTLLLPDGAKVVQLQDRAPGHCQDRCTITGEEGLNARRMQAYLEHGLVNHLYSFCGTPEQCVNDHIHHDLKQETHEEVRVLIGGATDLTRMPEGVSRARGGPLVSQKGYKRGPHLYTFCLALARVWAHMPQSKLLASFVKLGYFSVPRALQLGEVLPEELKKRLKSWSRPARSEPQCAEHSAIQDTTHLGRRRRANTS